MLQRVESRETLQEQSLGSEHADSLMFENRKVTRDLRRMFEDYNSMD